jgi:hypothetical protein
MSRTGGFEVIGHQQRDVTASAGPRCMCERRAEAILGLGGPRKESRLVTIHLQNIDTSEEC